ncbi:PatB family C-S lyase [Bacteroides nordii]|jgi:bifunctional PLP-dependent enzyme with beta-cystathionase and maltose regulon repressor activities|uniref:MalY/PatB family protein n=1 Tax=Bacteroides nordii TaxID=291645 RepID=UPI0009664AA4|nr:MAG: cystathionine beta-lyase [Bacteroides sp. 41_26]
MKYNFDEIIDRRGTESVKWDAVSERWGRNDLLPMWVADMDFRTPPFVMEALRKRLEHEVLGYTFACEEWYTSIINWLQNRHGWKVKREELTFMPGIVRGLAFAIQCFTEKGDKVMVMPPVYHPFFLVTEKNKREVVYSPLVLRDGQYYIDFDRFRKDIQGCKLLILSNPHNPGGRVWTREELEQIAEICYESKTLVISDEIHADLTLPPYQHITFALVSEKARQNSLVFMSPSKAFNMPGLASSYCIIENKEICRCFQEYMEASELSEGHLFAYLSVAAAYSNGTEWLDQVLAYIQSNIDFTDAFLSEYIPNIKMIRPQASYLVFLDCRTLGLNQKELVDLFVDGAHLALNDGTMFGKEGEGFMRLNVACPRSVLEKALKQLKKACDNR